MSRLSAAQGAIVTGLAAMQYTGTTDLVFRDVDMAGGQFSEKDLTRVCTNAPAAVVSAQRMVVSNEGGSAVADVDWAVVLTSKGEAGTHRYAQILDMLAEVQHHLATSGCWGLDFLQTPQGVKSENLYTPKLDAKGVTMWVVGWSQSIDLLQPSDVPLDDFDTFFAAYPDYEGTSDLTTGLAT